MSKQLLVGAIACGFPTERWTPARVGAPLEVESERMYSTIPVWRLLRAIGFSSQQPTRSAIQRDEAAILQLKKKHWPA